MELEKIFASDFEIRVASELNSFFDEILLHHDKLLNDDDDVDDQRVRRSSEPAAISQAVFQVPRFYGRFVVAEQDGGPLLGKKPLS